MMRVIEKLEKSAKQSLKIHIMSGNYIPKSTEKVKYYRGHGYPFDNEHDVEFDVVIAFYKVNFPPEKILINVESKLPVEAKRKRDSYEKFMNSLSNKDGGRCIGSECFDAIRVTEDVVIIYRKNSFSEFKI
jgi:hypothetical protein